MDCAWGQFTNRRWCEPGVAVPAKLGRPATNLRIRVRAASKMTGADDAVVAIAAVVVVLSPLRRCRRRDFVDVAVVDFVIIVVIVVVIGSRRSRCLRCRCYCRRRSLRAVTSLPPSHRHHCHRRCHYCPHWNRRCRRHWLKCCLVVVCLVYADVSSLSLSLLASSLSQSRPSSPCGCIVLDIASQLPRRVEL